MTDILVFGGNGQLARAFRACLPNAVFIPSAECDLSAQGNASLALKKSMPVIVINASAYTQVDKAEYEREAAYALNTDAPAEIAQWCADNNSTMVHFSTDYVFDGSGNSPWKENDKPAPLNVYGESKLAGERAISQSNAHAFIFRTSWVYDAEGKNFFTTMRRLMREKETLSVVSDQVGAPSYAPHLAQAVASILPKIKKSNSGIYHLAHRGETSWHGFAEAIRAGLNDKEKLQCVKIDAIASEHYPTPAKRPLNSRLDSSQAESILGLALPNWRQGLSDCLAVQ